jgi:two-component system, chemotaxis family, protein-glutamate methylesterase/glutaminase
MTKTSPIRVLIVEDSPVMQVFLQEIIAADARLLVVGTVASGESALQFLAKQAVDVVSMDIYLPGMNGLETTRQIMQNYPTPIVVVSSHLNSVELNLSFNALKAGALAVLEKPFGLTHPRHDNSARQLCTQLVIMSRVKVIRQRLSMAPSLTSTELIKAPSLRKAQSQNYRILGIAASTGGPKALVAMLNQLGAFPLPILLVQHISAHFLQGFADWLESVTPFRVVIAKHGEIPLPQHIYMAPAETHFGYQNGHIVLLAGEPISFQRPSGTILFRSLAKSLGPEAIGVILTGMGDDGADGLLEMRQAGAYTLAEAESTAVVYGMPAVAEKKGAVCQMLPLTEIAPHLRFLMENKLKRVLE